MTPVNTIMHQTKPATLRPRQAGGTLLGLIVGLILGLAIAVVVALYISKAPVPFINKAPSRPADKEVTSGPLPDPNKPLYGNNPAKPTEAAVAPVPPKVATDDKSPEATLDELIANVRKKDKTTPSNASANNAAVASNANTKVVVSASPNVVTSNVAATPGSDYQRDNDPYVYFLQAGAFKEKTEAETQKGRLALLGLEAKISDRDVGGTPLFRVRLGPFAKQEDLNKIRSKLSENEIEASVVRMPRQ